MTDCVKLERNIYNIKTATTQSFTIVPISRDYRKRLKNIKSSYILLKIG